MGTFCIVLTTPTSYPSTDVDTPIVDDIDVACRMLNATLEHLEDPEMVGWYVRPLSEVISA